MFEVVIGVISAFAIVIGVLFSQPIADAAAKVGTKVVELVGN